MQSAKNYVSNFCPFWWNGRTIVFIRLVFPQFGKYVLARLSLVALLCDMKNRARLACLLARSKLHQSAFNSPQFFDPQKKTLKDESIDGKKRKKSLSIKPRRRKGGGVSNVIKSYFDNFNNFLHFIAAVV